MSKYTLNPNQNRWWELGGPANEPPPPLPLGTQWRWFADTALPWPTGQPVADFGGTTLKVWHPDGLWLDGDTLRAGKPPAVFPLYEDPKATVPAIKKARVPNRVIPSEPGATFTLEDGSVVAVIHAPLWKDGDGPPRWLVMPGTYAPRTAQAMHHGATESGELVAVLVSGPRAARPAPEAVVPKPAWTPPLGCKVVDTRVEPYKSCKNPVGFTFDWSRCKEHGPSYFHTGAEWIDRRRDRAGWGLYDAIVPATWEPVTADVRRLEGASNFMLGATMAMLWRGALRLSKGHVGRDGSKVWGEAPMHGAPWTAQEGAVAIHNLMRNRGGAAYASLERFLYTSGRIGLGAPYLNRDDVKLVAEVIRREAKAL